MDLASISSWGALPDGMPLGSGHFPTELPQCPKNGLVMYRQFSSDELELLPKFLASPEYLAWRANGETPYYLAYQTEKFLKGSDALWLLLSASWEAKNAVADGQQGRRYNEEFVQQVLAQAIDPRSFDSIAARARAANALRELSRFDEAEALRASVVIDPSAGGGEVDAVENRSGWTEYLVKLSEPIRRRDAGRQPIDLMQRRDVVFRCLATEAAERYGGPTPPPLSPFEIDYCARSEFAGELAEQRKRLNSEETEADIRKADEVMNAAAAALEESGKDR